MNILFEIAHPAHVHFFRESIIGLRDSGHSVWVVTRSKEMTNELLAQYKIPYIELTQPSRGLAAMAIELLYRWVKITQMILRHQIDVTFSISGISTSVPSFLSRFFGRRTRALVFTDTEDANLSNRVAFPFADRIITPAFYLHDLGSKHQKYSGLHEAAYLRDFDFERAREIRRELGAPHRYSVIRLVSNDALHDRGLTSLRQDQLLALILRLRAYGEVFISSQSPLPESLAEFRFPYAVDTMHAVLSGACVFVGDSPTMAVESALLGIPALLVTPRFRRLGNLIGLERIGLLQGYENWSQLLDAFPTEILTAEHRSALWGRSESFRRSCVPVRDLIDGLLLEESDSIRGIR